ncbi:hypothetical protein JSY14_03055 [Brachybacterium sp. EF45031]|uniref:hypothetical protein n=1 Tax=Brachybacterium sillae TaxID=2810536 RepID=UPI00217E8119|nr:hypothetical protein [Brachybacterium sillae]MCS6711044.1 hypothetical protein [Brachybacterium sillae]
MELDVSPSVLVRLPAVRQRSFSGAEPEQPDRRADLCGQFDRGCAQSAHQVHRGGKDCQPLGSVVEEIYVGDLPDPVGIQEFGVCYPETMLEGPELDSVGIQQGRQLFQAEVHRPARGADEVAG